MSPILTTSEALAAMAASEEQNQRHVHIYYYALCMALFLCFLVKIFCLAEMAVWSRKNNKARRCDLGYDMGNGQQDQHLRRATIPVWRRVVRAFEASCHKYFAGIHIPYIRLSLAELCLVGDYVILAGWCLLDQTADIPASESMPYRLKGWTDRAGLLAFASIPFTIMLSTKISIIAYLTGSTYDRYSYMHRWVGRCTLGLAIIHGASHMVISAPFGHTTFQSYGLGAFCTACIMLVFLHRWSMRYFYEIFVRLHNIMVILLIALLWNHMPRRRAYLVVSLTLWGFDRLLRYSRLFLYNGLWRCKDKQANSTAALRLLGHDTTRLELYKPDFAHWSPGSFAFISTPTLSWLPQSHPFTIASRPMKNVDEPSRDFDCLPCSFTAPKYSSTQSTGFIRPVPNQIFLIRARGGWTKKICELAKRETHPNIPILVDGPYGGSPLLHIGYDTVLLFAGGAGLSWTVPLLLDLVERNRRGRSAVRKVTWICVLRHYVNYDWFFQELESLGHLSTAGFLDLRIHYTTNAEDIDMVPQHFHPGRPDIRAIIENAVQESLGRIFVGVAGPQGPSDEVRRQCRRMTRPMAILRGDPRGDIHFHTELFGW